MIWLLALLLVATGAALLIGGGILIAAGGSVYYALAGLALLISAVAFARREHRAGVMIYGFLLLSTLAWSLWEVGLDGWALAPRLIFLAVLGLLISSVARGVDGSWSRWWILAPVLVAGATLLLAGGLAVFPQHLSRASATAPSPGVSGPTEWLHWGNTVGGSRYAGASQIHTGNVHRLELAWRFDSDAPSQPFVSFEGTPLAADGRLYVCLQPGIVAALDQDTGRELWRYTTPEFERIDFSKLFGGKCRGVSRYESQRMGGTCQKSILFGTPTGKLVAVDAETGKRCGSFGNDGAVDLLEGMGAVSNELLAMPSSPPAIVNGVVVVGQSVTDLGSTDAPPGVVRGYDAETGALRWAWDPGRPERRQLGPNETYMPATPNAWTVLSGDEELDLVFVPTGSSLPDYFGGLRTAAMEKYATSVVALDAGTGEVRWSFQTVHHDLWDYDNSSQPVTVDLPSQGARIPALIVPTKRGQIFVLDRRTGEPIDRVVEKPVPGGGVAGERIAPTQPYTIGFPSLVGLQLREEDTWGLTPVDQLWCRIRFKHTRYEGEFTPVGTQDTLIYPGTAGGINWGSVTVDIERGLMMVNTLSFASVGKLIPRSKLAGKGGGAEGSAIFEQTGTPYAFAVAPFMSPLSVPCLRPPYGKVQVFNLRTRALVWSRSLGTAARSGPLGIPSLLPIPMGVPNMGGSVATAGGVAFIGASQDRRFRAFDIGTGRELWSAELPAVGGATPMTYVSPKTGRQYVVIAAGGHFGIPGPHAAALMAFALPD